MLRDFYSAVLAYANLVSIVDLIDEERIRVL